MSELDLTEDDVREEHMANVRPWTHWAYLFGVLGAGLVLMLLLVAALGGGG